MLWDSVPQSLDLSLSLRRKAGRKQGHRWELGQVCLGQGVETSSLRAGVGCGVKGQGQHHEANLATNIPGSFKTEAALSPAQM